MADSFEWAVSTAEAKSAATETAQEELYLIVEKIWENRAEDREELMKLLNELIGNSKPDTSHFLNITQKREEQHFYLVNKILPTIEEFKKDIVSLRKEHDYSKDKLFYFVVACFYDGNIKGDKIEELVKQELQRHYRKEPHHPEYEHYNKVECSSLDITEMAIDRLCRNLQWGNGIVNMELMKQFIPQFPKGDNNAKGGLFWKMVEKYQGYVQGVFYDTFPNTKEWSNPIDAHSARLSAKK